MRTLSIVAIVLCFPAHAAADSDGYFCVGRGYLAYERRLAPAVKHELRLVRFDSTIGIVPAQPIELDDFQVHAMRCLPGVVELTGWNTVYSVDISSGAQAARVRATPRDPGQFTPPDNLGHWAKPQVLTLDADGGDRFQLVIARVSQRVAGGIDHHVVSRIIQRRHGLPGREIIRSLLLFEGVFRETID